MSGPSPRRWWTAALVGALALVSVLGVAAALTRTAPWSRAFATRPPTAPWASPGQAAAPARGPTRCPDLAATGAQRPLPSADAPPVLLVADAPLLAFLDGAPWYSGPEAPRRLEPGPHTLRLEAPSETPLELRFEVERYAPVLLHGAVLPGVGITLVRLGGRCLACATPLAPPALEPPEAGPALDDEVVRRLLAEAAEQLRGQRWSDAAARLTQVPVAHRGDARFVRLAAGVYADAGLSSSAQALLRGSTAGEDPLRALLERHAGLTESERSRQRAEVEAAWNQLTQRLSRLLRMHGAVLPGAAAECARRFGELSAAFADATRDGRVAQQEELLAAARSTLAGWMTPLVTARPEDCALQAELQALNVARAAAQRR